MGAPGETVGDGVYASARKPRINIRAICVKKPSRRPQAHAAPSDSARAPESATGLMRFEEYYETLGANAEADAAAINVACRCQARLLHPVLNPGAKAHVAIARINEAYEAITVPRAPRTTDASAEFTIVVRTGKVVGPS